MVDKTRPFRFQALVLRQKYNRNHEQVRPETEASSLLEQPASTSKSRNFRKIALYILT